MKRLRHIRHSAAPQGAHNVDDQQQVMPIYDAIAKALRYWNVLALEEFDDLTYENLVVLLIQRLHRAYDLPSVESLVFEVFSKQQDSAQFAPDQALMMKFLADDIWSAWTAYLDTHFQERHPMQNERKPYEYAYFYTQYKGLYDRILTVLKTWDIWGISAYDGIMSIYEGEVVELLKHLSSTHNAEEVYSLLTTIFAQVDPSFDYAQKTEELHRMAQEIWFYWNQYLKVQDTQPSPRARALLLQL